MCRYLSNRLASSLTITGASPTVSFFIMAILRARVWPWPRARTRGASAVFHSRPYDVASRGPVTPRVAALGIGNSEEVGQGLDCEAVAATLELGSGSEPPPAGRNSPKRKRGNGQRPADARSRK